jgi:hypothetical protein
MEVQMPKPKVCKDAPTLWALEGPEVPMRNFVADPQHPQANKERMKGKENIAAT